MKYSVALIFLLIGLCVSNDRALDISNSRRKALDTVDLQDNLVKLNASHNQLTEIPDDLFTKTPDIVEIDLSYNEITEMDYNAFASNDKLKVVQLRENPIRNIDCNIFTLLRRGASVSFSWRYISEFQLEWCDPAKIRVVSNSANDGFWPAADGKIELHCNAQSFERINIFQVESGQFENAAELFNCLTPSLKWLKLSGHFDGQLGANSFERFTELEDLFLNETHLQEFDMSWLKSNKNLLSLDFSAGSVQKISNIATFKDLDRIEFLKIDGNNLDNVPEIIQQLNPSIKTLRINGNNVGKIDSATFQALPNIKILSLKRTGLTFDDLNPFEPLKGLQELDISHNNFESVNFAHLSTSLKNLLEFRAVNAKIANVPELMKLFGSPLQVLDLSENTLGDLTVNEFQHLESLQRLYLSNLNAPNLNIGILEHQHNLESLNISYDHLTSVNLNSLSRDLRELHLEGNELTQIDNFTKAKFPKLLTLGFSQNQFSCDYLTTFMQKLDTEWSDLEILGDPWEQKHGNKCH